MRLAAFRREALAATWLLAAAVAIVLAILGYPAVGASIALGLLLGSANSFFFERLLFRRAPLLVTSLLRLSLLSLVAIGFATLVGWPAWAVVGGVGAAQLVLSAAAAREGLRT